MVDGILGKKAHLIVSARVLFDKKNILVGVADSLSLSTPEQRGKNVEAGRTFGRETDLTRQIKLGSMKEIIMRLDGGSSSMAVDGVQEKVCSDPNVEQ